MMDATRARPSRLLVSGPRNSLRPQRHAQPPRCTPVCLLAATLGGCGAAEVGALPATLDACQTTALVVAADATADERASVHAAVALWHDAGGPPLRVEEAPPGAAEGARALGSMVPISFRRAAPLFYGLFRPEQGDILINRELASPTARAITIAHELGHAFGLAHAEDSPRTLMSPGNLKAPPSPAESSAIRDRRGACE
jgi:hypothetical protein